MADQKLNLIINGKNNAGPAVGSLKKGLLGLNAATLGLTAGFASISIGLKKSLNSFVSFEARLAEINTIAKLNKNRLKEVEKGLIDLSKRTPKSADELGAGFYQILSAGIKDTSKAFEILEVSTKLAVGGIAETGDTVKLVTGIINAYGFEVEKATEISDILFKTVENGVTTIAELAQFMGPLIPISKAAELSIEEVTAAIATLTAAGTPSRVAITALKGAIFALSAPTDEAKQKMKDMNIVLKDNLLETILQFQGIDLATIRKLIPEKEAAAAILSLADNFKKFGENVESAFDAGGSSAEAFTTQMETAESKLAIVWNKIKALGIGIGEAVAAGLVGVTDAATSLTDIAKAATKDINILKKSTEEIEFTRTFAAGIKSIGEAEAFLSKLYLQRLKVNSQITDQQRLINRLLAEKITGEVLDKHQKEIRQLIDEKIELQEIVRITQKLVDTKKIVKKIEDDKKKEPPKETIDEEIDALEGLIEGLEKDIEKRKERIDKIDEDAAKEAEIEEQRRKDLELHYKFIDALRQGSADREKARLFELQEATKIYAEFSASVVATSLDAIGASISTVLSVMLTSNKNFAEQMRNIWKTLVSNILAMIGQLIARMIALQVLTSLFPGGKIIGKGFKQIFGKSLAGMFGISMQTPHGGSRVIPGPPNMPVPFIGHGGETVGRGNGGGMTLIVQGDFLSTEETNAKLFEMQHEYKKRNDLE